MAVTSITGDAPSVPAGSASLREKATGANDRRLTWRLFPGRLVGFGLNLLFFIVCFQVYKLARKTFITGGDTVGCDPIHPIAACGARPDNTARTAPIFTGFVDPTATDCIDASPAGTSFDIS